MKKVDKETKKLVSEGQKIADFVNSEAWRMIRRSLYDKLMLNDSITAIDFTGSNETLIREVMARAHASRLVLQWIGEVEGRAKQASEVNDTLLKVRKESIYQYFGDDKPQEY